MATLRDCLWTWGHQAGSHDDSWNLPGPSSITPAAAAQYLGTPNLLMVGYRGQPEPPFDAEAQSMAGLDRVVWSIIGDSSSKRNDKRSDLDEVVALAERFPNISGAIMDDFFNDSNESGPGRRNVADLAGFRRRLRQAARPLDLWVVLYAHQLGLPVGEHLEQCEVVSYWTWKAEELAQLEENFARLETLAPGKRKVLGCYMWDYGAGQPMPLEAMQYQWQQGVEWLNEGRIEGMVFLASCLCDLGLETVEWTRRMIAEHGGEPLAASPRS